ncbi:DUF2934 domain-containing protein [Caballeronia sordidicola]|uniref:DUF2934 domain-containing protein n=1 Tax=Caballeronia sordidicola TaxID=196367 RepID=UPI000B7940E1|nr:DUF2934 domain-containing protein [Caballeronia sordidicola]
MDNDIDDDQLRARAYELWEKAGSPEGRADEFWEQAYRSLVSPTVANKAVDADEVPSGAFDEDAPVTEKLR